MSFPGINGATLSSYSVKVRGAKVLFKIFDDSINDIGFHDLPVNLV